MKECIKMFLYQIKCTEISSSFLSLFLFLHVSGSWSHAEGELGYVGP